MDLTSGTGLPPEGWDADEACARVFVKTHQYPPHIKWRTEKDEDGIAHTCTYCARTELLEIASGDS